jgi:hypothetical protein
MSEEIFDDPRYLQHYGNHKKAVKFFISASKLSFDELKDHQIDSLVLLTESSVMRDALLVALCHTKEENIDAIENLLLNLYQVKDSGTAPIASMLSAIYCIKDETFLARRWVNLSLAQDPYYKFAMLLDYAFEQSMSTQLVAETLIALLDTDF